MKKINITCESNTFLPVSDLEAFQGKLKTITETEFTKLKTAIIKYGFSFPVFVWKTNILDGHQRVQAVRRLIDDGYELDGGRLPVVSIHAENRREAGEKLLLINSKYGKIDQEGFELFIEDFEIDIPDFSQLLDIPEIVMDFDDDEVNGDGNDSDITPDFDEAQIEVQKFDKYLVQGKHVFICCGVSSDWTHWKDYLKSEDDVFCPYASFYIFFSEKAEEKRFIVLQPNQYLFSKMLEMIIRNYGEETVKKI